MGRVLVVDDDLCVLQVAKTILERSGFRTLCADNGLEALKLLQTHDVDVLLTDEVMVGMSGGELILEALRQYPNVAACSMTAYAPLVDRERERVPVIAKPFALTELVSTVRRVLEQDCQTRSRRSPCPGSRTTGTRSTKHRKS
jgi:CheY-like chemotaxis protein